MEFKLTNHEIEKIKSAYLNGEKQIDIAKKYGITQGHVSSIISGRKRSDIKLRKLEGITKINITKGDGYMNIEVHGHNEDNITCAGISAIIQTCELGLKALAENRKNVIIKEYEQDICDM
jgi:hypothetical protein